MSPEQAAISFLADRWRSAGVVPGDSLLVHSSLRRTLRECAEAGFRADPNTVLLSLEASVENSGTLLFPLFNFSFPETAFFDIRRTPSQMGALTEAARRRTGVIRTGHPIYSFAAIGGKSSIFSGLDNKRAYGEDSPFGLLRKIGGKIAAIDVYDHECMTFYHHVEEVMQVNYRYPKAFSGQYIDSQGRFTQRTYEIYVRDIDRGVTTDVEEAGEALWDAGLYSGHRPHVDSGMRLIDANAMFRFVQQLIQGGRALGMLYSIKPVGA